MPSLLTKLMLALCLALQATLGLPALALLTPCCDTQSTCPCCPRNAPPPCCSHEPATTPARCACCPTPRPPSTPLQNRAPSPKLVATATDPVRVVNARAPPREHRCTSTHTPDSPGTRISCGLRTARILV